ncbi:hypothetical protein L484_004189 [Morus notabilis]|uniref:Synaptonemal complex protein 1 n=1 Tax=Morus notabilis TaxID=981085 RepID=W9RDM3_9ROSA|nr:hypothetical protein L484_004189 [Morus notabilis]
MEHIRALEEKLQNAFNENAKLKVKQKEDEKLWNGLESKFSSTKTLCDQLTETLQQLASQVHDAEKDKEFFQGKLSASAIALDNLNQQMNGLSLKLDSAGETIRKREKELEELKIKKEERDKCYRDEMCRTTVLIEEKDAMIRNFETTVEANRLATENLNSKLGEVKLELNLKGDQINHLLTIKENLEKEKSDVQLLKDGLAIRIDTSLLEIKKLESLIHVLASLLAEVDKQSLTFLDKFDQLNSLYESCFKLVQQEKDLATRHAQRQYDQLHDKFLHITSEKDALQLVNQELTNKVIELQKVQESIMAQLSEEGQKARERIQKLQSEAEILVSKKIETEKLVLQLQLKIDALSESSKSSENKMQDLLLKILALENENESNTEQLQGEMQKKVEEIGTLQKEGEKRGEHIESLEKQLEQLRNLLEEKDQRILQYKERQTKLEEQITEVLKTYLNQVLLTAAESRLAEARKQYDVMLESKQLELSRHLKDLSQRNDQAINDIRKKYEDEKLEIVNMEKAKAEKLIGEMEAECDQKVAECKEESKQYLARVQEEHATLKMTSFRNEHEAQMRALRCQHEDECIKLQEELDLQKSKEDRQRALLQLQWKVMGDKVQEDQEVNSKKDYSISSLQILNSTGSKRSQRAPVRPADEEKDSPFLRATQTPVSKLLKKVEKASTGSVLSIPKHHKKATTYSMLDMCYLMLNLLFHDQDPRKQKKMNTPKANTPRSVAKLMQGMEQARPRASNIGDLFREGSLDPYADDPYAFD